MLEVTESSKHASILYYEINYCYKTFYDIGPGKTKF